MKNPARTFAQLLLTAAIITGMIIAPRAVRNPVFKVKPASFKVTARKQDLPVVGSYANLKRLVKESLKENSDYDYGMKTLSGGARGMNLMKDSAGAKAESSYSGFDDASGAAVDFSQTNIQVEGVDEADIVKTDGEFIYQVGAGRMTVTRAQPGNKLSKAAQIDFSDQAGKKNDFSFSPLELYVNGRGFVVIGQTNPYRLLEDDRVVEETATDVPSQAVKALIYKLNADDQPRLVREVEIEGSYLSSRRIGSALYLVTNKFFDPYLLRPAPMGLGAAENRLDQPQNLKGRLRAQSMPPAARDSAGADKYERPDFSDVRYFPDSSQTNYLTVTGFDLSKPNGDINRAVYLGGGEQIYASTKNLYVTLARYDQNSNAEETDIHKFALENGATAYKGRGTVPGRVLNQFSMDEYGDHFRLATTLDWWSDGPRNNVYVLDAEMKTVGRLEGLARGERIYSARFMGDRAYVVTFRQMDPLFVIDLKNPSGPAVLGELKIPGYSDYLHPIDDNHIIGFGRDVGGGFGPIDGGIKIAVFDVSDVAKPVEKWKTVIGDMCTESPLLQDHRALLFDLKRRIVAFPVIETGYSDDAPENSRFFRNGQGGGYVFQGLYVYQINEDRSLELRGKVSHMPRDGADPFLYQNRQIVRGLYINDTLYSISNRIIKANDLDNLKEIDSLDLGPITGTEESPPGVEGLAR